MTGPSIEDLKRIQRELNLCDVHVVWIGPLHFVIAHTDEERATIDLEDCELHNTLLQFDPGDIIEGYYKVMVYGNDEGFIYHELKVRP